MPSRGPAAPAHESEGRDPSGPARRPIDADAKPAPNAAPAGGASASPPASRLGREWCCAFVAALALYLASVAPGVLWQDNGLVQLRVVLRDLSGGLGLALSHPLYYVLAIAAQALPFDEPAFKSNLVSAFAGAITVANVLLLLRRWTARRTAAAVGALSLALAHTFWQHAAMAETYTTWTALFSTELLCLHALVQRPCTLRVVLLFLVNGLGLSVHLLSLLSLPVLAALALSRTAFRRSAAPADAALAPRSAAPRLAPHALPLAMLAWLAGASLYLAMIVRALADGEPADDVLRSALFGYYYAQNVLNTSLSWGLLVNSVMTLGLNFPTPLALLALGGLATLGRGRPRALALGFAALLVIHLAWAVHYDIADRYTFFIPTVLLTAVLIGLGADALLERMHLRGTGIALLALAALPTIVYWQLPNLLRSAGVSIGGDRPLPFRDPYTYFLWPWKTGYDGADRFVRLVLDDLPRNAYLIADGTAIRPIQYRLVTRRERPDLRFWPPLPPADARRQPTPADLRDALAARLIYVVTPRAGYCPDWLARDYQWERAGSLHRIAGPRVAAP